MNFVARRSGFVKKDEFQLIDVPGNPIQQQLVHCLQRVIGAESTDEEALVYAWGRHWGPESTPDEYFGFVPGRGQHDIHMNQGTALRYTTIGHRRKHPSLQFTHNQTDKRIKK